MCRLTWRYQIYDPVRRVLVLDETTGSTCEEDGVDLKPKKKREKKVEGIKYVRAGGGR